MPQRSGLDAPGTTRPQRPDSGIERTQETNTVAPAGLVPEQVRNPTNYHYTLTYIPGLQWRYIFPESRTAVLIVRHTIPPLGRFYYFERGWLYPNDYRNIPTNVPLRFIPSYPLSGQIVEHSRVPLNRPQLVQYLPGDVIPHNFIRSAEIILIIQNQ